MATRKILYNSFLTQLSDYYLVNGIIQQSVKQTIEDNLILDNIHDAISILTPVLHDPILQGILTKMDEIQRTIELLEEDIDLSPNYLHSEVINYREYCYKSFAYSDTNIILKVITSECIKESVNNNFLNDTSWKILETIILKKSGENGFIDTFLDEINNHKFVFILTDCHETNVWRLYSYSFLNYINQNEMLVPAALSYPATTFFSAIIHYEPTVQYEQYFDAYHVMYESKHVNDVLNRYLRMYQILELFAYRCTLVKISNDNYRNSAFVRNVIKNTNKLQTEERKKFIDGFKICFPNISSIITDSDLIPYTVFLDNTYLIKRGEPHDDAKVAKIIYSLRNSVVHNKESELHFSFGNISEYQDGINLMKLLLIKMEKIIIDTINNPTNPLVFTHESMPLY